MQDVTVTVPPDWVDRIAKGYMCLECYQPFETAYPEVCTLPGCGYEVAKRQRADFDRAYRGTVESDVPTRAELERRDEETLRQHRMKRKGVWLPGP